MSKNAKGDESSKQTRASVDNASNDRIPNKQRRLNPREYNTETVAQFLRIQRSNFKH